jgi:DMSO/TMAO reductase YedYZ molybdopterin-dependent catalytic subunit
MLAMMGLGAAGIVGGKAAAGAVGNVLRPITAHDPTGLSALVPGSDDFQIYTVTDGYPAPPPGYRLVVDGLVGRPLSLSVDELALLPATSLVKDFQCVTGWRVPGVHWKGVALSALLDRAEVTAGARALSFESFDGVYTESLTLAQARRPDVIAAYQMLGGPVDRQHGGPVRLYVAPMYGYKSIKWLSRITVVDRVDPGYWEREGYAVDGWVGASNGRDDAPIN